MMTNETKLKKAKRLLKAAIDDVRYCMRSYDPCEICLLEDDDGNCPAENDEDCGKKYKWRCEDEVLALIGEDIEDEEEDIEIPF